MLGNDVISCYLLLLLLFLAIVLDLSSLGLGGLGLLGFFLRSVLLDEGKATVAAVVSVPVVGHEDSSSLAGVLFTELSSSFHSSISLDSVIAEGHQLGVLMLVLVLLWGSIGLSLLSSFLTTTDKTDDSLETISLIQFRHVVDTSGLTKEGYWGLEIEVVLNSLLETANGADPVEGHVLGFT